MLDGTQTDDKGSYPTGSVYFNPPGSGHEVRDSSGFFLLAYASPPDFAKTDLIEAYTPIRIDTRADLKANYPFEAKGTGVETFAPALHEAGGMSAVFIVSTTADAYIQHANYLTVIDGTCTIDGKVSCRQPRGGERRSASRVRARGSQRRLLLGLGRVVLA